ncbi:hypothetical protein I302_102253 [Kwoniella bestiolae CBS 10118]|uniref:SET domain-containing protein n=1 Tax=Kwoniella bestiolae CBS 10118 TaxID=1296100 RepID=A0A1B9GEJ0_9TREE|nr:hypothetical protein I302_00942 [Kwoniella bestiolae CBS 10118]OCF29437.1 hypothetical protein I302_00942 [Kwoniella bestiolae CBS 10118]
MMGDISKGQEPFPISSLQDDLGSFNTYITDSIFPDGTSIASSKAERNDSDDDEVDDLEGNDPWTCSCTIDDPEDQDVAVLCTVRDSDSCDCVSGFGNFYTKPDTHFHQLLNLDALPERLPLVECSPQCPCFERCANKLTQRGVRVSLITKPASSGIGLGLFYTPNYDSPTLPKGTFISLYAGEYLTTHQARQRWIDQLNNPKAGEGNYVLSVKLPGETWHIDPRYKGNIGRFLNHSCEPNCVIQIVRWGVDSLPRAAIFTKRDVVDGEELTFDYANASGSTGMASHLEEQGLVQDGIDQKGRTRCLCASERCRGWMPFDERL